MTAPTAPRHELVVSGLRVSVGGTEILRGVDLVVRSGEVHAIMGPNGSGKSTLGYALLGHPGYTVTAGSVTLDGVDMLALAPHERAAAGLFLAQQYPVEVPGVSIGDVIAAARGEQREGDGIDDLIAREADLVGLDRSFLDRALNVDFSGGEKKRNETVQMAALRPAIAILDEIDSGLDVDALAQVSRRIEAATTEWGLGVVAVTHYNRLLEELRADVVHIFAAGRILESGGPELATRLEREGYSAWTEGLDEPSTATGAATGPSADPFADPLA